MDDNNILICIILKYGVNVGNFINWFTSLFGNSYTDYCRDISVHNLSETVMDEFGFKFLVAFLTWKDLI